MLSTEHGKERKGGNFHYDMDCRNGTTTTVVQLLTAQYSCNDEMYSHHRSVKELNENLKFYQPKCSTSQKWAEKAKNVLAIENLGKNL